MTIFVSSNVFIETSFDDVFDLLKEIPNNQDIGIEIFPNFKNAAFQVALEKQMPHLKQHPISLHGPYFNIEHSAAKGTEAYDYAMAEVTEIFELAKETQAEHIVFHHNNKIITPENKVETISEASKNLAELNKLAKVAGVPLYVENAGVNSLGTNLFTEEEFIAECLKIENEVLIDIGHAHANGWNLEAVIKALGTKIKVFHVHNNDGVGDGHQRIFDGSLDFKEFQRLYQTYTPTADIVLEYGYQLATDFSAIVADIAYIRNEF